MRLIFENVGVFIISIRCFKIWAGNMDVENIHVALCSHPVVFICTEGVWHKYNKTVTEGQEVKVVSL